MFSLQWNIENIVVPLLVSVVSSLLVNAVAPILFEVFCSFCRTLKKTSFFC